MSISNSFQNHKDAWWMGCGTSRQSSFHYHSNILGVLRAEMAAKDNQVNKIELVESSPEKAGVGGSIPSLATIKSII